MKRLVEVGVLALAVTGSAAASAQPSFVALHARPCAKLFTPEMGRRAAAAIYSGTRTVSLRNLRLLGYIERCQRFPVNQDEVRTFDRHLDAIHKDRIYTTHQRQIASTVTSYGSWAIPPAIVQCESTFQNLPPNSAGASGYYQIIVSTWLLYGGGRYASQAYLASKAEQDIIAAKIWDGGRGARQWVCKA